MKSPITTHVLDTVRGCPAKGIHVVLEKLNELGIWESIGDGTTDIDGRISDILNDNSIISPGAYRLTFDVTTYFQAQDCESFYSTIPIVFTVKDPNQHYHVPLVLNPFGYSTYRGR